MWVLATPTPGRSLREVEDKVLGSPGMHHLSYHNELFIIRYVHKSGRL
jgi:hypothetical protein